MDNGSSVSRQPRDTNKHVIRSELVDRTPQTTRALLFNHTEGRWTWHVYVRSDVTPLGRLEHMFRCNETGVMRVWGVEPA